MGMADYVSESFHDLLTGVSENISDSDSSETSHHPSHECFMENIPNGHVEEDGAGDATPTANSSERSGWDTGALPPHQQHERQEERRKELDENNTPFIHLFPSFTRKPQTLPQKCVLQACLNVHQRRENITLGSAMAEN